MRVNSRARSSFRSCRGTGSLRRGQRGQSMTEYVIIAALALILLVVPVGLGPTGNMSVVGWMIYVLHQWWVHYSYLISLP
jgi:hypothetical protein